MVFCSFPPPYQSCHKVTIFDKFEHNATWRTFSLGKMTLLSVDNLTNVCISVSVHEIWQLKLKSLNYQIKKSPPDVATMSNIVQEIVLVALKT